VCSKVGVGSFPNELITIQFQFLDNQTKPIFTDFVLEEPFVEACEDDE
jgi:hypothetical protein